MIGAQCRDAPLCRKLGAETGECFDSGQRASESSACEDAARPTGPVRWRGTSRPVHRCITHSVVPALGAGASA